MNNDVPYWADVFSRYLIAAAVLSLVVAVILMFRRLRARHMNLTQRQDRDPSEVPGDVSLQSAVDLVCRTIAEDLGVSPLKIYLNDNLRTDLGYVVDKLGLADDLESLLRLVAKNADVTTSPEQAFLTVMDVARFVAAAKSRKECPR